MENPSFSDARDSSDPLIGELIDDRYRVERVLGTGGTGTVYLAEHVMMEKRVALKVLHATHAVISSAMDRFQREAIALARIEHPNVVSATDFGKLKNGAYYLALEYVEGFSLGDALAQERTFDLDRALAISYQIASALGAAHSQGIIHRDLKAHNVMLSLVGDVEVVKVLDFGLAKLRSKATEGSISMSLGQIFGTPHYMAPEQISGEGVDHRVDLYALGVITYEMLAGVRPFESTDVREILSQQATQEPPPLPDTVPAPVRALVGKLLAKDKDGRPATAGDVMAGLEPLLAGRTGVRALLRRQIRLGGLLLPVWALAAPAAAFAVLFLLGLSLTGKGDEAAPASSVAPVRTGVVTTAKPAAPALATPTPELMAGAEFGEPSAIDELLRIPAKERDRDLWLVLVKGCFAHENPIRAMELLREAIDTNNALAEDGEFSRLVREGASDPEAAKLALATAAEAMGQRGADILFSVWADTKHRTPTTALAEQYLQRDEVRGKASPALKLALELRNEFDCEAARQLLSRVQQIGDTRTLRPLAKLRNKRGCGPAKRLDCYQCLRDDELLETAIAAAADRTGPKH